MVLFNMQELEIYSGHANLFIDVSYKIFNLKDAEELLDFALPGEKGGTQIKNLNAVTYNLENGQIVEHVLTKTDAKKEKVSNKSYFLKFSLSNVKKGSVVRIRFKVTGPIFVDRFYFQRDVPILYSQFSITNYLESQKIMYTEDVSIPFAKMNSAAEFQATKEEAAFFHNKKSKSEELLWLRRNIKPFKVVEFSSSSRKRADNVYIELMNGYFANRYNNFKANSNTNTNKKNTWEQYNESAYTNEYVEAFAKHDFLDSVAKQNYRR